MLQLISLSKLIFLMYRRKLSLSRGEILENKFTHLQSYISTLHLSILTVSPSLKFHLPAFSFPLEFAARFFRLKTEGKT